MGDRVGERVGQWFHGPGTYWALEFEWS
jgi:hypothetical protein